MIIAYEYSRPFIASRRCRTGFSREAFWPKNCILARNVPAAGRNERGLGSAVTEVCLR